MTPEPDKATYRVFRLGGRPVLGVPGASRRARLAGVSRFQPISFKRALFRRAVRLAIWTGLDRFCSTSTGDPLAGVAGFELESWRESLESTLGVGELSVMILWPPQADRGRAYVHLLSKDHRPVGFAKVSFDAHNDERLEHEAELLGLLAGSGHREFRVPGVLDYHPATPDSHTVLVLEPIPSDARPVDRARESFPADCVRAYAGEPRAIGVDGPGGLSWWGAYQRLAEGLNECFVRELERAETGTARLCRVHGDLTFSNLVRDSQGRLWIYDWEESCADGPVLADEVGYFLGQAHPKNESELLSLIARFRERFLDDNDPQHRVDVMLALAFRTTVHPRLAGWILSRWDRA